MKTVQPEATIRPQDKPLSLAKENLMKNMLLLALIALMSITTTALANPGLNFVLSPGFPNDPMQSDYLSGGPIDANRIWDNNGNLCSGFIASQPDHIVTLTHDFTYLRLFVESWGDTTLVLHQPSTGDIFCDDDSYGNGQPEIEMNYITRGEWHVYVGSYRSRDQHDYTLNVTEFERWFAGW